MSPAFGVALFVLEVAGWLALMAAAVAMVYGFGAEIANRLCDRLGRAGERRRVRRALTCRRCRAVGTCRCPPRPPV